MCCSSLLVTTLRLLQGPDVLGRIQIAHSLPALLEIVVAL
jgi:hypothetical protein